MSQTAVIANDYGVDCYGEDYNQHLKQKVLIQILIINQYYLVIWTVELLESLSMCYTSVLGLCWMLQLKGTSLP